MCHKMWKHLITTAHAQRIGPDQTVNLVGITKYIVDSSQSNLNGLLIRNQKQDSGMRYTLGGGRIKVRRDCVYRSFTTFRDCEPNGV